MSEGVLAPDSTKETGLAPIRRKQNKGDLLLSRPTKTQKVHLFSETVCRYGKCPRDGDTCSYEQLGQLLVGSSGSQS